MFNKNRQIDLFEDVEWIDLFEDVMKETRQNDYETYRRIKEQFLYALSVITQENE